ncbi:hypothetical protein BpHYR1_010417 [Brachionus plicatilis]|uniref:Uncharacterized protein n=1 Tax=Brachionus plicatilis TaxID=10195 RepID=A0A3M7T2J9_BRAPC|nr:hypothetical protein BpHYR1_010417 [Brachionus plicatilis]
MKIKLNLELKKISYLYLRVNKRTESNNRQYHSMVDGEIAFDSSNDSYGFLLFSLEYNMPKTRQSQSVSLIFKIFDLIDAFCIPVFFYL